VLCTKGGLKPSSRACLYLMRANSLITNSPAAPADQQRRQARTNSRRGV
jgi:hypothetical protein